MSDAAGEVLAIDGRYARRDPRADGRLYDPMDPYVVASRQERERGLIRCLRDSASPPLAERRILEVGCGTGANLADLIRLGADPRNLIGIELREAPLAAARARLPSAVTLIRGDASATDLADESLDAVLQSTVFTSILDDGFQDRLAARMWSLVRPGGVVLWYDFVRDNPRNPDVRGVPVARIRALFPGGVPRVHRSTLAPPIGRRACRISPSLYPILNAFRPLRTHVLCWIRKPSGSR